MRGSAPVGSLPGQCIALTRNATHCTSSLESQLVKKQRSAGHLHWRRVGRLSKCWLV
jgi:hypothetical protein